MKGLGICFIFLLLISMHTLAMQYGYERCIGNLVTLEDTRKLVTILSLTQIKANQTIVIKDEDGQYTYARVTIAPCEKNSAGVINDFKTPRGRAVNFQDFLKKSYLIFDQENTK